MATFPCRDSRTVASAGGTRQGALSGRDVKARASTSFFAHPSDKRLRPTTLKGSNSGLGPEACAAEFGGMQPRGNDAVDDSNAQIAVIRGRVANGSSPPVRAGLRESRCAALEPSARDGQRGFSHRGSSRHKPSYSSPIPLYTRTPTFFQLSKRPTSNYSS